MKNMKIDYDLTNLIKEEFNLDIVETTIGSNGYPKNLKYGLIGFNNFSIIEEIIKLYPNKDIVLFKAFKKEDWQLYERQFVGEIDAPLNVMDFYKNEYVLWNNSVTQKDLIAEIREWIEDAEDLEFVYSIYKFYENVWDEINQLDDDEVLITDGLFIVDTFKNQTMSLSYDSKYYAIGLFICERNEE